MEFREYLISKKIDPDKFAAGEPVRYEEFQELFSQMHPGSFTAQKLYLINPLRRRYLLEKTEVKQNTPASVRPKPVIRSGTSGKDQAGEASKKTTNQPKPAIRPRPVVKNSGSEGQQKPKPVIRKKPDQDASADKSSGQENENKPVRKRPVIKPKKKDQ